MTGHRPKRSARDAPTRNGGRAQRGFSLLEMTVAMAVAAVALAIAVGLIVQSHRMATQAALEIRAPDPEGPLALLENEIRAAAAFGAGGWGRAALPPGADGWSRDRLVLTRGDGSRVLYERDGDRLVRRAGPSEPTRTVVPELRSWRWRPLGSKLVAVEVVYDRGSRPTGGVVTPRGRRLAERAPPVTHRFVAALRSAGGDRGW